MTDSVVRYRDVGSRNSLQRRRQGVWCLPLRGTETRFWGERMPSSCRLSARLAPETSGLPLSCHLHVVLDP
jgi:hypothetical protein